MNNTRAQFSSRFGFLMAAAGAAVGLGNVWSFPSMAANNGGGAFLLVYVVMAFILAYPALMAELTLGRYAQNGIINAMGQVGGRGLPRCLGQGVGGLALAAACLTDEGRGFTERLNKLARLPGARALLCADRGASQPLRGHGGDPGAEPCGLRAPGLSHLPRGAVGGYRVDIRA